MERHTDPKIQTLTVVLHSCYSSKNHSTEGCEQRVKAPNCKPRIVNPIFQCMRWMFSLVVEIQITLTQVVLNGGTNSGMPKSVYTIQSKSLEPPFSSATGVGNLVKADGNMNAPRNTIQRPSDCH